MWRGALKAISSTVSGADHSAPPPLPPSRSDSELRLEKFQERPVNRTRNQFKGARVHVDWVRDEPDDHFFGLARKISDNGGEIIKEREDPDITHFVIILPDEIEPGIALTKSDVAGNARWKRIVRKHAKYWHCARQAPDRKRNKGRKTTVVHREWIDEVLSGVIKLGQGNDEGQWGIWLRSGMDENGDLYDSGEEDVEGDVEETDNENEAAAEARPVPVPISASALKIAVDPRVRPRLSASASATPLTTPLLGATPISTSHIEESPYLFTPPPTALLATTHPTVPCNRPATPPMPPSPTWLDPVPGAESPVYSEGPGESPLHQSGAASPAYQVQEHESPPQTGVLSPTYPSLNGAQVDSPRSVSSRDPSPRLNGLESPPYQSPTGSPTQQARPISPAHQLPEPNSPSPSRMEIDPSPSPLPSPSPSAQSDQSSIASDTEPEANTQRQVTKRTCRGCRSYKPGRTGGHRAETEKWYCTCEADNEFESPSFSPRRDTRGRWSSSTSGPDADGLSPSPSRRSSPRRTPARLVAQSTTGAGPSRPRQDRIVSEPSLKRPRGLDLTAGDERARPSKRRTVSFAPPKSVSRARARAFESPMTPLPSDYGSGSDHESSSDSDSGADLDSGPGEEEEEEEGEGDEGDDVPEQTQPRVMISSKSTMVDLPSSRSRPSVKDIEAGKRSLKDVFTFGSFFADKVALLEVRRKAKHCTTEGINKLYIDDE